MEAQAPQVSVKSFWDSSINKTALVAIVIYLVDYASKAFLGTSFLTENPELRQWLTEGFALLILYLRKTSNGTVVAGPIESLVDPSFTKTVQKLGSKGFKAFVHKK